MIHIKHAERGAACDCICAGCGESLIARQGDQNAWHFAHADEACAAALESALHRAAKEVLADAREIHLPAQAFEPLARVPARAFRYDGVSLETPLGDVRPDALLWVDTSSARHHLLIEIKVAHAVDERKRAYLMLNELACVEVDLGGVDFLEDVDQLRRVVLEQVERKTWVYHPKMVDAEAARYRAAKSLTVRKLHNVELLLEHRLCVEDDLNARLALLKSQIKAAASDLQARLIKLAVADPRRSPYLPEDAADAADVWFDPAISSRAAS